MLLLGHVGRDVGEQRRAEIALAGIGQHAEDVRALRRLGGDLQRAGERRARRDADEDAFLLREVLAAADRVGPGDRQDAVDHLHVDRIAGELRDEVRRPALHRMRLERGMGAAGEPSALRACSMPLPSSCASSGSQTMILVSGTLLREHARDALQRAAGAVAGHPVVELLALEVVDDLARRGARMHVGVGLVLELARQEPAVRLGKLDRLR